MKSAGTKVDCRKIKGDAGEDDEEEVVVEEDDASDGIGDDRLPISPEVAVRHSPSGTLLLSRLVSPAAAAAAAAALITLGIAAGAAGGRRSVSWMVEVSEAVAAVVRLNVAGNESGVQEDEVGFSELRDHQDR